MTESVRHHDDGFQAQTDPVQAMVRAHAPGTDRLVAGGLGSGGDFSDFSHEWRRLFSRLLGTFLLVLVAAGASVIQDRSTGQIGRIAKVAAPALTVLTVNLFMSAVSRAHLNPIVSVTFALGHDFRWRRVPGYILAQLLGALLAALLLRATFGDSDQPMQISPRDVQASCSQCLISLVFAHRCRSQLDLEITNLALK